MFNLIIRKTGGVVLVMILKPFLLRLRFYCDTFISVINLKTILQYILNNNDTD